MQVNIPRRPLLLSLLVAVAVAPAFVSAETRFIEDTEGRVVLEIRDDGTRISYSYAPDGRVIKTNLGDGSRIETGGTPDEVSVDPR